MNYIGQIKGFWIAQEAYQLGSSEIALYFYLLEVCNKTGWTGTFYRNNYKVMVDLSIKSYKTLQSIRDRLQNADIIKFSQRNGDANVAYTIADLSKFYQGEAHPLSKNYLGKGKGSVEGKGKGSGKGSVEVNINETKLNETKPFVAAVSPPKDEKQDEFKIMPYWQSFINTWHQFYQTKHNGEKYSFLKKDFGCLKQIYEFLKTRAAQKNYEWTEQTLIDGFLWFLNTAYDKDEWMRRNLSIPNLLSQFNQIVNGQQQPNSNNGKQSTGGHVSAASAFSKIDRMFS